MVGFERLAVQNQDFFICNSLIKELHQIGKIFPGDHFLFDTVDLGLSFQLHALQTLDFLVRQELNVLAQVMAHFDEGFDDQDTGFDRFFRMQNGREHCHARFTVNEGQILR